VFRPEERRYGARIRVLGTSGTASEAAPLWGNLCGMRRRRLVLGLAVTVVVAGAVFFYALPSLAAYGAVWRKLSLLSAWWMIGLLGVTAVDILTYAPPWLMALPKLRHARRS